MAAVLSFGERLQRRDRVLTNRQHTGVSLDKTAQIDRIEPEPCCARRGWRYQSVPGQSQASLDASPEPRPAPTAYVSVIRAADNAP